MEQVKAGKSYKKKQFKAEVGYEAKKKFSCAMLQKEQNLENRRGGTNDLTFYLLSNKNERLRVTVITGDRGQTLKPSFRPAVTKSTRHATLMNQLEEHQSSGTTRNVL
jgi:hypothetical protein